jgi:hypothetical protein
MPGRAVDWEWRVCWHWQPRLPDPSYASPALGVVIEDKSGAALAWIVLPPIVITLRWLGAGTGRQIEDTMPHDKIKAAARKRMAETGEPYTAARHAVVTTGQVPEGPQSGPDSASGRGLCACDVR